MAETSSETSYDVLEWFPILVCQNIFKYLDGKDVIQASAVNKEWYKLCAESQQSKKLKLVLRDSQNHVVTDEDVEVLKKSKRKYENIVIDRESDVSNILPLFLAHEGSWKSVKLDAYYTNRETWSELLRTIEPSVEDLTVGWSVKLPENIDFNWTFPCLKVLKNADYKASHLLKIFTHCTTIVKFHWTSWGCGSIEVMKELLRNNRNLKDLAVSARALLEHPTEFRFKLDKLVMNKPGQTDLVAMYAFLETQAQTLKSLEISAHLNLTCFELILSMPNLSSLTTVYPERRIVQANTTITSLEFTDYVCSRNQDAFKALIRSLTSLKHFKCRDIDNDKFVFLAREVPALESFAADRLYVIRFPEGDIFPNLKEFKVGKFIHGRIHLQEPTGDNNFAKLARKAVRESVR